MLLFFVINNEVIKVDFEKLKEFIIEKKFYVGGIIILLFVGGYIMQKNNQPVVNNQQVLSENKTQSTSFLKVIVRACSRLQVSRAHLSRIQ